jgi:alpha-methylacyl-CoA racemase
VHQLIPPLQVSGARYVSSFPLIQQALHSPFFSNPTGSNPLDGGAPYYGVYRCKEGQWFTLGAIEPQFYANFLKAFIGALPPTFSVPGLNRGPSWRPTPESQLDREEWADIGVFFEAGFLMKTRDEWTEVFDGWFRFLSYSFE